MIHIVRNKNGKLEVVVVGKNGKLILHSNPQEYERKTGCYTAIRAAAKSFNSLGSTVTIQDDTFEVPKLFMVHPTGRPTEIHDRKVGKKYVMGK